jgi:hypothetical protein
MTDRLVAALLAFVLLLSGIGTFEVPVTPADAPPSLVGVDTVLPGDTPRGSIEHHHLDDQPFQVTHDPVADGHALLPALAAPSVPQAVSHVPWPPRGARVSPPDLAGLLRPPIHGLVVG